MWAAIAGYLRPSTVKKSVFICKALREFIIIIIIIINNNNDNKNTNGVLS